MSASSTNAGERETTGPAVSVVVPAYMCAPYIAEALDSVFAQTFTDFEVVVVNDGSPDTPELERALGPYRRRVTYLAQENRGPAAARNTGIRAARGRFVAFLDADDAWLPEYLSEQVRALGEDPTLDAVYADAELFGDSALAGKSIMEVNPSRGEVTLERLINFRVVPVNVCTVARREALLSVGLFREGFYHAEDFHLYARLVKAGRRIGYRRKVLARVRMRPGSLTADKSRLFAGQVSVYQDLLDHMELSPRERALLEEQVARARADLALEEGKRSLAEGEYERASESLARANGFYRSGKLSFVLLLLRAAPGLLRRAYELRHAVRERRGKTAAVSARATLRKVC